MSVRHFISDRFGGVSKPPYDQLNIAYHTGDDPKTVSQNRILLAQKIGINDIVYMDQIHSDRIEYVDRVCTPRCDGIVTDKPNLALAVMSADCYGVLLSSDSGAIAALHAGRAGAMKHIVEKVIVMLRDDFNAKKIEAIISPGIGSCCYEVGEEILKRVEQKYIKNERFLDIKAMIIDQLQEGGATYKDYNICTCCNPRYYSYRRDGTTGRFASIIWKER